MIWFTKTPLHEASSAAQTVHMIIKYTPVPDKKKTQQTPLKPTPTSENKMEKE
jgi:hypothetical protein